jgi:hypothetical protein
MAGNDVTINIKAKDQTGTTLSKVSSTLLGINQALMLVRTASDLAKKALEFSKEGAQLEYLGIKFNNLAVSVGTTADVLMDDLHKATSGMVSDAELMASAGDFMALGLAKTRDEVVRLATVAGQLGMNMNQLVLTLTNQTTMRFDALGVSVDGFKERVKALEDAGMDANEAFTEAFLQQAEAQIERVGSVADTTAGDIAVMEAAIKNMGDAAKVALAEGIAPLFEKMTEKRETKNAFNELADQYQSLISSGYIDELNTLLSDQGYNAKYSDESIRALNIVLASFTDELYLLEQGFTAADGSGAEFANQVRELKSQFGEGIFSGSVTQNVIDYYVELQNATGATEDLTNATIGADLAMKSYNDALLFTLASQGLTADQAYDLAVKMGMVDQKTVYATEKQADFKAMLDDGAISLDTYNALVKGLADYLNGLPNSKDVLVNVKFKYTHSGMPSPYIPSGITSVGQDINIVPEAAGGPVFAQAAAAGAGAYWVGEVGPELFIPAQDGRILSNSDSMRAVGAASGPNQFYDIDDLYDVMNKIAENTEELVTPNSRFFQSLASVSIMPNALSRGFREDANASYFAGLPANWLSARKGSDDIRLGLDYSVANMKPALGPQPEQTGNYWQDFVEYWLWNAGTPPPMEDIYAMYEEFGNMLFTPTQGEFVGHRSAMQQIRDYFDMMGEYGFNWDDSSECWKFTPTIEDNLSLAWALQNAQFNYEQAYRATDVPFDQTSLYQSFVNAFNVDPNTMMSGPAYTAPSGEMLMGTNMTLSQLESAYQDYKNPTAQPSSGGIIVNVTINSDINTADEQFVERTLTPYITKAIREAQR